MNEYTVLHRAALATRLKAVDEAPSTQPRDSIACPPSKAFSWFGITALLLLAVSAVSAPTNDWAKMRSIQPHGYVCHRATEPIQVDGRLNEAAWAAVPWTEDFADIEGPAKPKPKYRTRAKMLWDDSYFYIAAELDEPHVWGTLTQHDAVIFQDNDFEVFIDPNGDTHEYYEFEMNALNTTWDLLLMKSYKDGGPALNSWDIPGLKTAVHVNGTINQPNDKDRGWTLEIAFPWKALGEYAQRPAPPREGDQWRVNFSRVEWQIDTRQGKYTKIPGKKEDNWVWSPQGIIDMHRPEKWGFVLFTGLPPGQVRFVYDPGVPARDALQEIYYAQRQFHEQHRRWAATLADLGLNPNAAVGLAKPPVLHLTADGYEASAQVRLPEARFLTWRIRQDGRVWWD